MPVRVNGERMGGVVRLSIFNICENLEDVVEQRPLC